MDNTTTIYEKFLSAINLIPNNIRRSRPNCTNGNEYIELRNVIFEVDKNYIFPNIENNMSMDWYIQNYDPILDIDNQYNNMINEIVLNYETRRAIIVMNTMNEYDNDNFICTSYIHLFVDYNKDENIYYVQYIVHMRSNDVIEFQTDIMWHDKLFDKIIADLTSKTNKIFKRTNIIWNADTLHLYIKYIKNY